MIFTNHVKNLITRSSENLCCTDRQIRSTKLLLLPHTRNNHATYYYYNVYIYIQFFFPPSLYKVNKLHILSPQTQTQCFLSFVSTQSHGSSNSLLFLIIDIKENIIIVIIVAFSYNQTIFYSFGEYV
ncbi:hypothetical protein BDA99DRAFT_230764 [Phascolomyces articulosus]|uniref:Uncharacterized protein n=1 Tax=Phascolomyces articulosus TaxID=60185 RepID=A0AAD5JZK3_9FUNG|nr:hypothetical protein BDA99DRAFT_230764 [Phascolomyces articulosus]